jgi:V-type H+-transporting ATPase subunit G
MLLQHEGSQSDAQSQVEKETQKELEGIEEQYKKNREAVVDKLLERVVRVKMELHRNAIKAE